MVCDKRSGQASRSKRPAAAALGAHAKPRGKVPRGMQWDYEAGQWRPAPAEAASSPSDAHRHRARDAAHAKELFGLKVDVPMAAFGGDWATCTATATSMVVRYGNRQFTVRVRTPDETRDAPLAWPQLLGEAQCHGMLLELQFVSFSGELTPKSCGPSLSRADCSCV